MSFEKNTGTEELRYLKIMILAISTTGWMPEINRVFFCVVAKKNIFRVRLRVKMNLIIW